jgi:putative acetyltransferase
MNVGIRREQPGDAAQIREVNELAFGTPLEATIVDAVRGLPDSLSLVAIDEGGIVGHILFTPVTLDPRASVRLAALAPMSVRPNRQRQGVGGALIRAGVDACRAHGYAAIVLVGHPEYYPRFGFVPAHTTGLECEFDVPADAFMVLELEPGTVSGVRGIVRFRPEFRDA